MTAENGKVVPAARGASEAAPPPDSRNTALELAAKLRPNSPARSDQVRRPFLTRQQVQWIAARMQSADDEEASEISRVPIWTAEGWLRDDPDFGYVLAAAMADKVEGVRILTEQMIPAAMSGLYRLLDDSNPKAVKDGVTLLLKVHGLIDQKVQVDKSQIQQLIELLREEAPIPGDYRVIEEK